MSDANLFGNGNSYGWGFPTRRSPQQSNPDQDLDSLQAQPLYGFAGIAGIHLPQAAFPSEPEISQSPNRSVTMAPQPIPGGSSVPAGRYNGIITDNGMGAGSFGTGEAQFEAGSWRYPLWDDQAGSRACSQYIPPNPAPNLPAGETFPAAHNAPYVDGHTPTSTFQHPEHMQLTEELLASPVSAPTPELGNQKWDEEENDVALRLSLEGMRQRDISDELLRRFGRRRTPNVISKQLIKLRQKKGENDKVNTIIKGVLPKVKEMLAAEMATHGLVDILVVDGDVAEAVAGVNKKFERDLVNYLQGLVCRMKMDT
ncbi:hypothetical protein QBC46DRAFT_422924 [Diplogelasinospora grovesii]|uniref:Uncharacterized protein n=1 Tax=Diplogelasinospora grovesii TaxID=303347 RepID=A0AAN6MZB0_9PEZI|nr:hypothetical protein QBC46DRAFT_422924 [Diplogelasinospora grovesii]